MKRDLLAAVESDDELGVLVAMREIVASRIANDSCPARELASLTKRLSDLNTEIRALRERQEDDEPTPDEPFDINVI